jgi:very-short-patch-repair endonuclease
VEQEDKLLRYSQKLRKSMTKEERHLWYDFLKTYPVQFRRQYPIAPYIVDFYCYKARLVVELDGSQHCDSAGFRYDAHRTAALEAQGLTVIRFSNLDVTNRFREVCEVIDRLVHCRMSATNTK